ALQVAGRSLAIAEDDGDGTIVELAGRRPAAPGAGILFLVDLGQVGDAVDVARLTLVAQVGGDTLHLLVGNEGTMHAHGTSGAVGEQHVAFAQEMLCTLLVDDGAAVE